MVKVPTVSGGTATSHQKCTYDAWNRLVVDEAPDSTTQDPVKKSVMTYDGRGRRIIKTVTGSGDMDHTYHYYYDGQQIVETRNGSGEVLKQQVWGVQYVDELVQIGINQDPSNATSGGTTENECERFFWVTQDANYNILGVVNPIGDLVERYEYTPYGRRTVFTRGWLLCDLNYDGTVDTLDETIRDGASGASSIADLDGDGDVDTADEDILEDALGSSVSDDDLVRIESSYSFTSPVAGDGPGISLCEQGHQGLMHDKEFDLIYNRARYYDPILGRFIGTDPKEYIDGNNLFAYLMNNPGNGRDPTGTWSNKYCMKSVRDKKNGKEGYRRTYRTAWGEWYQSHSEKRTSLDTVFEPNPERPRHLSEKRPKGMSDREYGLRRHYDLVAWSFYNRAMSVYKAWAPRDCDKTRELVKEADRWIEASRLVSKLTDRSASYHQWLKTKKDVDDFIAIIDDLDDIDLYLPHPSYLENRAWDYGEFGDYKDVSGVGGKIYEAYFSAYMRRYAARHYKRTMGQYRAAVRFIADQAVMSFLSAGVGGIAKVAVAVLRTPADEIATHALGASVSAGSRSSRPISAFAGPNLLDDAAGVGDDALNKLLQGSPIRNTTILGNDQTTRVVPFAERTGARTLENGLRESQWNALKPKLQWKVNDGQLRKHINAGDLFRDIGPDGRIRSLDLRKAELLRLGDRGIPVETVSPEEFLRVLGL